MSFFGSLIAPLYCGRGFAKFEMGKYGEAIPSSLLDQDANGKNIKSALYKLVIKTFRKKSKYDETKITKTSGGKNREGKYDYWHSS